MTFRKTGVAIATLAAASAALPAPAAASVRDDAQCLMVYSIALGQYEDEKDRDYSIATGLYALVGYFSGKLTSQLGVDSLRSVMTEELAAEVAEDYASIQTRCVAESEQMADAMIAAGEALSGK